MLFKLICLHEKGVALSEAELAKAPRYTGNLVIHDWREGNASGRALRVASLHELVSFSSKMYRDLLPPLFEPVLVKMTDKQLTLHGYVIDASEHATNGIAHYSQYWVLQMVDQHDQ